MSLKEKAEIINMKVQTIRSILYGIQDACEMVQLERQLNGKIVSFSAEDKQSLLAKVKSLVTELETAVATLKATINKA